MFRSRFFCTLFLVLFLAVLSHANSELKLSDFRFNIGAGIRNQTPVVAIGGIGYKNAILRVQGMGFHNGPSDFWCGVRGSLLWTFFMNSPINLDAGIGGGYEYAEAPNDTHKAINKANKMMAVLPYNFKEIADITIELWVHIYGLYTQISVPAQKFKEHDSKKLLWGAGYIFEF